MINTYHKYRFLIINEATQTQAINEATATQAKQNNEKCLFEYHTKVLGSVFLNTTVKILRDRLPLYHKHLVFHQTISVPSKDIEQTNRLIAPISAMKIFCQLFAESYCLQQEATIILKAR